MFLLGLLPQFEPLLWGIFAAVFAGGLLLPRFLRRAPRPLRLIPSGFAAASLLYGEILWHTAQPGGLGEGRRATAALIAYFALPALAGMLAGSLAGWIARRGKS